MLVLLWLRLLMTVAGFISSCHFFGSKTCLFQDISFTLSWFGRQNVHLQSSSVFSEAAGFL